MLGTLPFIDAVVLRSLDRVGATSAADGVGILDLCRSPDRLLPS